MAEAPREPDAVHATQLLRRSQQGDAAAAEELLPAVYEQLRAVAADMFRRERAEHTLQPTALVHEAYAKLVLGQAQHWQDREHFCALAATAMRQILCDHARARRAAKRDRGSAGEQQTLVEPPTQEEAIDVLVLDECLAMLLEVDEQAGRVVDLRFFGGMTHPEIARVLAVSVFTVDRAWRRARAWIQVHMDETPS